MTFTLVNVAMYVNLQPSSIKNHLMRFVLSMGFALASWFLVLGTASQIHGQAPADGAPQAPLSELVPKLRQQNGLIGLAAMVTVDGKVIDAAVDGLRLKGRDVPLDIKDRWHLGSITKSITATMIARLVESGEMQWTDKVGDYFKDGDIHEDWKSVTLRQLLTHTSGAPSNFSFLVMLKRPKLGSECTQARRQAVMSTIKAKPNQSPGEKFAYSNVGYTIAGAMAEQATGEVWEDLIKREVYEPLGLKGAGFGPPESSVETLPQPRGHVSPLGFKVGVDDQADNTPIMGPAATVHMTLEDLCTFAIEHARGHLGKGLLLSAENYQQLHRPELNEYACGWMRESLPDERPYTVYWHNGSNTMWYALVVFIPETKMVIAVTSNDGDIAKAEAAAWKIVAAKAPPELAKQFQP